MSNTEEKTNENDEKLEKVIVEEEGDQLLKNESGKETDPNLQNDNQLTDDENEINLEDLIKERDELKDKLIQNKIEISGEPTVLVYNSPYKVFNRRNEIIIPINFSKK